MNKKQKWECPNCKETIMLEMWHSVAQCKKCGTLLAGVFDGPPGDWGRKRIPVKFSRKHPSR